MSLLLSRLRFRLRVWWLGRIRLGNDSVVRRRLPLLAVELLVFAAAASLWLLARPATPAPAACGDESNNRTQRLAFVQRSYAAMGVAVSWIPVRLRQQLRSIPGVADVGAFRNEGGGTLAVSRNLLPMVGATPRMGRLFTAADPLDVMLIVSDESGLVDPAPAAIEWRGQNYHVVGRLDRSVRLVSAGIHRIVPLSEMTPTSGTLLLLDPGVSRDRVEQALRQLTGNQPYRLSPYVTVVRWYDPLLPGLALSLLAWLFSAGYLRLINGTIAGQLYWTVLGVRLALLLTATVFAAHWVERWANRLGWPVTILHFWFLLVVCFAACYWVLKDQLGRCPQCLERLAFPTRVGTYGSLMLDAAATEYACPRGHGLLAVPDTEHSHSGWTALDSSWSELFDR